MNNQNIGEITQQIERAFLRCYAILRKNRRKEKRMEYLTRDIIVRYTHFFLYKKLRIEIWKKEFESCSGMNIVMEDRPYLETWFEFAFAFPSSLRIDNLFNYLQKSLADKFLFPEEKYFLLNQLPQIDKDLDAKIEGGKLSLANSLNKGNISLATEEGRLSLPQ